MKVFSFNKDQASKQDAPRSISQNGAYIGKIVQAEMYETQNGAQMFEAFFKTSDGSCTIQMCVCDKEGNETYQVGYLQSLMGLLGVQKLELRTGTATNFKDNTTYETTRIPSIENKPIGVLFVKEIDCYTNKQGETKEIWNMRVVSFFDAVTKQTFHEKDANKDAKFIEARLNGLKDRKTKRYIDWINSQQKNNAYDENHQQTKNDFLDDDIPF